MKTLGLTLGAILVSAILDVVIIGGFCLLGVPFIDYLAAPIGIITGVVGFIVVERYVN